MISEMQLVVSINDTILHTLTNEIKSGQNNVNALQEFQKDVNLLLTKMIGDLLHSGNNEMVEDEYCSTDDDQPPISPKKTRK